MPGSQQAMAVRRVQTTSQERIAGEAQLDDPDIKDDEVAGPRPAVGANLALLVARAVVVNEWMFLNKMQLRFEYFEDRVFDCIG